MNSPLLKITIGSHFFKLTHIHPSIRPVIMDFARKYIKYGLIKERGVFKRVAQSVFGAATKNREEFRFHINQYEEFKEVLRNRNFTDNLLDISKKPTPSGDSIQISMRPQWVLREEQVPVVEYLTDKDGPISKLVELQTGSGKSLLSMYSAATIGKRFVLLIRPMYIGKWIEDAQKYLNIEPSEIMVVQGGKNLQALIHLAIDGQLGGIKVIIISNKTYQHWITLYEDQNGDTVELGYPISPEDFFEILGCGIRIIDEIHLDLHLQFKTDLYTNVASSIGLSATFLSTDRFVEKVQEIMYPLPIRYKGGPLKKYVSSFAAFYSIKDMTHIRTKERGQESYSHTAFEKSIRKNSFQLANYKRAIKNLVDTFFMDDYRPGERCIVFASSIDMCTHITAHLKQAYPNLLVNRFVDDDPDENLYESDISVSTVMSGGTAHDIANLKTVVLTSALDSKASNIQVLGRLRYNPNMPTRFVYMVCSDIAKHMAYHDSKKILLAQRAKNYREYSIPVRI